MRLMAIGQLTAGVAHELNNPLSVILGYVQSLMHDSNDQEALKSALKTVEREAQRCKRVVQDLLNFARLPRPGKVLEDVIQVLEGALSLVETQTRIQHVELIREFSNNLPTLYLDRHRIQQMIVNLCINALDAMPKGGQLKIKVSLVSKAKEPPIVEIQVSDTGTGIPPEIRDRIFEPFFTTKESGKGTGLGLSLVRDIVKGHGGRLEVFSEQNRGTLFTIRLPATSRLISPQLDGSDFEEPPVLKA
jgi:two-component system NtrC family sensor kinase